VLASLVANRVTEGRSHERGTGAGDPAG